MCHTCDCCFDRLVGEESEAPVAEEESSSAVSMSDQQYKPTATKMDVSLEALAEASDEFVPTLGPSMDATADGAGSVSSSSPTPNLAALAYATNDAAAAAVEEDPKDQQSAAKVPPASEQARQQSSTAPDERDQSDGNDDGDGDGEGQERAAPTRRGSGMAIFKRLFSFR